MNFVHITYTYLPRKENQFADALVKLALMVNIPSGIHSTTLVVEKRVKSVHCCLIDAYSVGLDVRYYNIYEDLTKEYLPRYSLKAQRALRMLASQYFEDKGKLYKKAKMGVNLMSFMKSHVR